MRRFIIPAALVAAIGTAYGAQGLGRARGNPPPAPASMEIRLTPLAGDSVRVVASWTPVLDGRGKPVRDYTVRVEGPASAYVTSTTHTADTARVPLAVGDSLRVGVAANDSRGVQGAWGWSRWIVRAWGPPPAGGARCARWRSTNRSTRRRCSRLWRSRQSSASGSKPAKP